MTVDPARIRTLNDTPLGDTGHVLYWMISNRRTESNPALEHAVALANELSLPLAIFEPLRAGYAWASDRHHRFIMDGMEDNAEAATAAGVWYRSYVEPMPGDGKGLLAHLAADAAVIVTDDWPGFFLPRMVAAAAEALDTAMIAVDGVGLLPMSAAGRAFPTAHGLRRHLQKTLPGHLLKYRSARHPLVDLETGMADLSLGDWRSETDLSKLPIDHDVAPTETRGGPKAAAEVVSTLMSDVLERYHDDRNHPDRDGASGLSPWLHYGHVSSEQIVCSILDTHDWPTGGEVPGATGSRGWWGLPEGPEAFLDEIITWRETGHVFAWYRDDSDQFGSIPDWAKKTLAEHADDPRDEVDFDALEAARSPDPLWNAAQRQLVESGRMHNYLRMLWGKLVLAWAPDPQTAFEWITHWNNKYALDGRDPNSECGLAWIFGRHDRAWGPERPIYGKVRYMTSRSTRNKLRLKGYLERWGD